MTSSPAPLLLQEKGTGVEVDGLTQGEIKNSRLLIAVCTCLPEEMREFKNDRKTGLAQIKLQRHFILLI
jgi:hypothetical protein